MFRITKANYCSFKCLKEQIPLKDTSINAIEQSPAIKQIKIQKGGTPQFRSFYINQFGRPLGEGGKPLSNFR